LPAVPEEITPAEQPAAPATPADRSAAPADLSPAACAGRLCELFPAVFGPGAPRPLKLRIQADVQQRAPGIFTKKALSHFLQRHTTASAYLKALVNAQHRVDLDGQPAGDIADEHREAAAAELDRRRALHDARRAAERDAQRAAQDAARRAHAAQDQARSERATLLRAHETTTLTRKNFCALKGVAEAELDAMLALARQERDARAAAPRRDRPDDRIAERAPRTDRADPPRHRRTAAPTKAAR
jgi:sRNA-binding protein